MSTKSIGEKEGLWHSDPGLFDQCREKYRGKQ